MYVDDLIITRNNDEYISSIKKELKKVFDMTYLGLLEYYLEIEIDKKPQHIFISQKKYVDKLLNIYSMTKCNLVATPMEQNLKLAFQTMKVV